MIINKVNYITSYNYYLTSDYKIVHQKTLAIIIYGIFSFLYEIQKIFRLLFGI